MQLKLGGEYFRERMIKVRVTDRVRVRVRFESRDSVVISAEVRMRLGSGFVFRIRVRKSLFQGLSCRGLGLGSCRVRVRNLG